jgi:hypothetical protein
MSEVKNLKKYFPNLSACADSYISGEGDLVVTMRGSKFGLCHGSDERGEVIGVALLEPEPGQRWAHAIAVTPELDPEMWAMKLIAEKFLEIRG